MEFISWCWRHRLEGSVSPRLCAWVDNTVNSNGTVVISGGSCNWGNVCISLSLSLSPHLNRYYVVCLFLGFASSWTFDCCCIGMDVSFFSSSFFFCWSEISLIILSLFSFSLFLSSVVVVAAVAPSTCVVEIWNKYNFIYFILSS